MKNFKNLTTLFFVLGILLLSYAIFEQFVHHLDSSDLLLLSFLVVVIYIVLSLSHRHYTQKDNVKGIVLAEFIHSLVDGAVIGLSFLISPATGMATLMGVFAHEVPKVIGSVLLINSLVKNIKDTIKYILLSLSGIPLISFSILFLGEKLGSISQETGHMVQVFSLATLIVIMFRIIIHAFRHKDCC